MFLWKTRERERSISREGIKAKKGIFNSAEYIGTRTHEATR